MKKIPTLFERIYSNHEIVGITPKVTEGMEWVLEGKGVATLKLDGSCCAIINGELYKRFDAKPGRKIPEGAIPCCPPDPITGHHPHWVKCDKNDPADRWFFTALSITETTLPSSTTLPDGTYEATGVHFQGNPYNLDYDILKKHGAVEVTDFPRTFEGMDKYFKYHYMEGIVFWLDGEPKCKIKRSDFGYSWNGKKGYKSKIKE